MFEKHRWAVGIIKSVRALYPTARDDIEAFRFAQKDLLVSYQEYQEIRREIHLQDFYGGDNNFHFTL